jgi:hypothetical protein
LTLIDVRAPRDRVVARARELGVPIEPDRAVAARRARSD